MWTRHTLDPPWTVWTCSVIPLQDCRACTQSLHSMGSAGCPGHLGRHGRLGRHVSCRKHARHGQWPGRGRRGQVSDSYTPGGTVPTVYCTLMFPPCLALSSCTFVSLCVLPSALPRVCPAMSSLPLCGLPSRPSWAQPRIVSLLLFITAGMVVERKPCVRSSVYISDQASFAYQK